MFYFERADIYSNLWKELYCNNFCSFTKMSLKMCRICCDSEGTCFIFNEKDKLQISHKIMYCCAKLKIAENDGLPSRICKVCDAELTAAYRFVLKCEAGDKLLRSSALEGAPGIQAMEYDCKVEVKSEVNGNSDDDRNDDVADNYPLLKLKQVKEIKPVNKLKTKVKRPYKRTKCKGFWRCSICNHNSLNQSALSIHMRCHTGETPFSCSQCDKKYKDQGSLKRHNDRHHCDGKRARNFMCENCGKSFFSKNDVKVHMRTHTGETPYICSDCPMKFTQIGALTRHKKRHKGEKPHICSTCPKRFCTKEELKLHMQVHTNEKKYVCNICNVPFKYQNNLKKHMFLHSEPNRFICNHCGRTFNQKGNLKSHISRQHSEKSGHCSVCLKNVSDIEAHMWRHTGQRPLKCEICSSSFFDLKNLARHVNFRHKNTDKYKCAYEGCSMAFPSRPMLHFHTAKLHETQVPFPCDRCARGFYRKNDLARHKIGTHKEKLAN